MYALKHLLSLVFNTMHGWCMYIYDIQVYTVVYVILQWYNIKSTARQQHIYISINALALDGLPTHIIHIYNIVHLL